ncbi:MAG: hypothetical protein GY774_38805 [Planctomycetes bacterium]|nr:hypothetical protein [Planctomycetota bacterium]
MCRKLTCLASLVLLLGVIDSTLAELATNPYPANGAQYADTNVILSWLAGKDAVLHDIYFGDSFNEVNNGVEGTFQGSQDSTTFAVGFPGFPFPEGLVRGRTYYWRIDEVNDINPDSPWKGTVWSFTVRLQQGSGQRASNPFPANGAIDVDRQTLEWTPGNTAVVHKIYLSNDAAINEWDLVAETDMSLVAVSLDPGMTYYWRIDEVEKDGTVIEGFIWSFTTLPLEAHFPSPANGASKIKSVVILSWTAGKGAIMYDLYFGMNEAAVSAADPSTFRGKLMDTSFDPGPLERDTTYYWRIDEFSVTGTIPGPVWYFTTIGPVGGVKAEYFVGKIPQGTPCRTDYEPSINHNWSSFEVPCSPTNGISARWTANLVVPVSNTYTFYTTSDDGVHLYINRQRIIDDWPDYGPRTKSSQPIALVGGQIYPLEMEWYDNGGSAVAQLSWETPTMARQIIPPSQLIPTRLQPLPDTGLVVEAESFEHFTADIANENAIFQTWIGGHNPLDPDLSNDNGSSMIVGNDDPPYVEEIIVYSGSQSMPLRYHNSREPYYSQADRTWDTPQDWTPENGIIALHMQVHGRRQNALEPFYARIEDTAGNAHVVFNPDSDILVRDEWTSWWIRLSDFADAGVDLTSVKILSFGIGYPPPPVPPPGSNDNWTNATHIGDVKNLKFDTTEATIDGPEVCMRSKNIWYCYTAPRTGRATISLCESSFDTKLAVYDGCGSAPTWAPSWDNLLQCRDDFCDRQSQVAIPVTAGQKYLIEVGGYNINRFGQGILNITCDTGPDNRPENDDWFNAERVYSLDGLDADTTGATKDGPGDCVEGFNIWYWYKATSTREVTITLVGAGSDVELAVYEGLKCPTYESRRIVCENLDEVTFDVIDGQDYLIEVGGSTNGYFALTSGSDDDCYNAKLIGNVTDLTFDTSKAGPVGPILPNSPTVAQLGKKVYDISYKADLPSQILDDGPKLLENHEPQPGGDGKAVIDQIQTVGEGPALLSGSVRDPAGDMISGATVTLIPIDQVGDQWYFHETKTYDEEFNYFIFTYKGVYDVTVTKGSSSIGPIILILNSDLVKPFVLP